MDTTRISSLAFSGLLRGTVTLLKAELAARSREATTGRLADTGLSLGAETGRLRSMTTLGNHLAAITDANSIAGGRLSATQASLDGLAGLTSDMMAILSAGDMLTEANAAKLATARATLGSATSLLNASLGGAHLFGGINTQAAPMAAYEGGPTQVAFRNAFLTRFGFDTTDPAALSISAADITDFLQTTIRPMFDGADWTTNMSSAADEAVTSRLAPGETAVTSVGANEQAVRTFFMAASVALEFLNSNLGGEASRAVAAFALSGFGEANKGIADLQGRVGVMQQRVARASEANGIRGGLLEKLAGEMTGVDAYEAASRVNALTTQLEMSYALTARLQNLSLVKYLS